MKDSAEILSHERSTSARPRDPVTSSPDSSFVPSARTVTRYYQAPDRMRESEVGPWVKFSEVDPLLSALAESERLRQAADDQLLAERNRLLDLFECPQHGKGCVSWAIEAVKRLKHDSHVLRECGIVEIAVHNDTCSVGEYMKHWEDRALKAEASLVERAQEIERLRKEIEVLRAGAARV